MSAYIAKKAKLNLKRECCERSCCCFTDTGYYIKYTNQNVDSVLFVCEDCFETKYKAMCTMGDFQEENNKRPKTGRRYDRPVVRRIVRMFNRSVKAVRFAIICILIIGLIFVVNKNTVDTLTLPEINTAQFAESLSKRFDIICERLRYILTEERETS